MLDHPASILRIAWLYGGNSTHTIGIGFRIQNRAVFSPYSSELPFISVVKSSSFALSLTFGRFHPQPSFFPYTLSLQSVAVIQSPSHASLFVTLWILVRQASLSFTISQSLLKLISIVSVMPSNHLILCHPLLLLPSIFPTIRVFSSE